MAEYPTSKLNKALARKGLSNTTRPSWQEVMERHDTVPSKALQAPEVIQGFTGSWAAQFVLGAGQQTMDAPESPAPIQRQRNHLGQPGMAEINFRPYDWGTTRHGKYGPSLLGHPVSFQVVGPTIKSPNLLHQWRVDISGVADILTLDSCTWRSTAAAVINLPLSQNTIPEIYGLLAIPEEGLYLVVSMTGAGGHLDDIGGGVPGDGGVGDGLFGEDLVAIPARAAVSTQSNGTEQRGKYEIFRVTSVTATEIYLDSSKRLQDFFTVPVAPGNTAIIRAVTLIKPATARVVAVPGSGARGKEQTFAIIPPEKSLNSDLMPPVATWTGTRTDPWTGYGPAAAAGNIADYPQANALPIPRPIRSGKGRLRGIFGEAVVSLATGRLLVVADPATTVSTTDLGKVVQIHNITRVLDATWSTATIDGGNRIGDPELDRLQGYWEIVSVLIGTAGSGGEDGYHLRMVTQVDPLTGVPFFGSANYMGMAQTGKIAGMAVRLQWTLHDPISELWTATYPQADKLNSARLQHLISPDWVAPTAKNFDLLDAEASPSRPDRAAFGTGSSTGGGAGSNENPGNLMDLGFRVVLYPAKPSFADPNILVANYDNPITSNEVVLDPSKPDEKQFIEVDYAAGLIYLSHPPIAGAGCELMPDAAVLTTGDNPRKEAVFFASYVAFSQEPGQRSTAPRVTGGRTIQSPNGSSVCNHFLESADMYGARLFWPLEVGQTITSQTTNEIRLGVLLTAIDLPPTGFVTLVSGNSPLGAVSLVDGQLRPITTFGYNDIDYNDGGVTVLRGCFGGGIAATTITPTAATPFTAVLRRDIVTPNVGDGSTGTDFQFDTTYGHNKRSTALRFKQAILTPEADGSTTVDTRDPLTNSHQELFSELFSSWVIRGGEMLTAMPGPDDILEFDELVVLIAGVRTVLPAQPLVVPLDGTGNHYVYLDGSDPQCPVYRDTNALPLPGDEDVLIGQYTDDTLTVTAYQDLRQPLTDSDKRHDITVGSPVGFDQPGAAHFSTLADAVLYVAEVMNPQSGDWGRYRRIKVIGPTQEDSAKLPISPKLSGLIIEGAGKRQNGPNTAEYAISWGFNDAAAPALFDLSECTGIVFKDLTFYFASVGPLAPSVVPRERCLFTCDYMGANLLTDAVFENIRLHGPAHGFFYCADDLDPLTGFARLTFRNCVATDLTDFAIRVEPGVVTDEHLLVDKCWFQVRRWDAAPLPELEAVLAADPGVIHLENATQAHIRDSFIGGGHHGLVLGGDGRHRVSGVRVFAPSYVGIALLGPEILVENTFLTNCYEAPTLGAFGTALIKMGVYIGTNGVECRFVGSRVEMFLGDIVDWGIFSDAGSSDNHVHDSTFLVGVSLSTDSHVTGCYIGDKLNLGDGCTVDSNYIAFENLGATANVTAKSNCALAHNVVDGHFVNGAGEVNPTLTGNWFKGTATANYLSGGTSTGNTYEADVRWVGGTAFLGDNFNYGIGNWGVFATGGGRFTNCIINVPRDITLTGDDHFFIGNTFKDSPVAPGPWIIWFEGTGNTLANTTFVDATTLRLDDGGVLSTKLVVQGNRFLGATQGGIYMLADESIIEGNYIAGYESFSATPSLYSIVVGGSNVKVANNVCGFGFKGEAGGLSIGVLNNHFGANGLILSATNGGAIIQGNVLGTAGGPYHFDLNGSVLCKVLGNHTGTGSIVDPGTGSTIEGNTVTLDINCTTNADELVICGNHVSGDINVTNGASADATLTGNVVTGTISLAGPDATVTGNRANALTVSGTTPVVTGNRVTVGLTATGVNDYIIMGNKVGGTILVDDAGAGAGVGILIGNRAAVIATNNAPLAGQVVVANRTTNIVGNTNFNTAPGVVTVVQHNSEV